jgi:photosystem II stability/assembly factor-like uncharacterized protein
VKAGARGVAARSIGRDPSGRSFMDLRNNWLRTAALAAAVLLAGCVTAPAPISTNRTLTGQEGAVVFKFITNGTAAFDPAETLASITLKRDLAPGAKETSQDTAILSRTRAVTNSTAVFSGMVAPGRYRIIQATGNRGNVTYTFPIQRMLTEFDVRKGEVSLLGTLVVQPLEGSRFTVGYVPPDAELTETFEALFPALARQTHDQPANTFQPSSDLRQRELLVPQVRQLTSAYNGAKLAPDGTVLAGGKMGRVIWHKPGAMRWRVVNLPTWKEVLSVAIYRGGLLVAGEEGLLRYSTDDGKTWQSLAPPDRGLIAAAEPLPDGKVIALVRRDMEWTAYASDDVLAGAWRKIGSFGQEQSLNVPWQVPITLASGTRVGVMMPNGVFQVVDGKSETIERHSTGVSTFGAQAMPDGMLVVRGGTMTASTLVSADGGKTWTDLNTSRFVQAITFADARTSYAVGPVDPGLFAGKLALMVSRDGAKTWTKSGEVPGEGPGAVRSLFYDRSDRSLFAFMQNGQVQRSTDEGKTWTRSL